MRKILLLVLLALAGVITWYFFVAKPKPNNETPELQPVAVSQYSDSLTFSINNALSQYFALSEGFVNWDITTVNRQTDSLKQALGKVRFNDLKKDTAIYETATTYQANFNNDLDNILVQKDIEAKRKAYNSLSQNMYDLLRIIKYNNRKVYLQMCPMAFDDSNSGLWLSRSGSDDERRNPYLGLHHPKYKSAMINCGETKDSLR